MPYCFACLRRTSSRVVRRRLRFCRLPQRRHAVAVAIARDVLSIDLQRVIFSRCFEFFRRHANMLFSLLYCCLRQDACYSARYGLISPYARVAADASLRRRR